MTYPNWMYLDPAQCLDRIREERRREAAKNRTTREQKAARVRRLTESAMQGRKK